MPKDYHLFLRGEVGDWRFDAGYVSYILDQNKDKPVNVLIDSLGGRVDSALSINSLFKIHGQVNVHFIGANASAATIAAMGANHISIDADACFLVHKCLNVVFAWDWMNADQLEQHIAELQKMKQNQDTLDACIAGIYARRCKKTKDELLALMKVGGWLTPRQALDWGFVDEITDYEEDEAPVITEAVASALCAEGIPLPPVSIDKGSFFERIKRLFSGISEPDTKSADNRRQATGDAHPTSDTQIQTTDMEKFPLLAALLGAAKTLADGNVSLNTTQLEKIEKSIADKNAEIDNLKNRIASKEGEIKTLSDKAASDKAEIDSLAARVADLSKAPAEDTSEVHDTTSAADDPDGYGGDVDAAVEALANVFR